MGYINKTYLKTQFDNFATRLSEVFSKIGHKHSTSDITDLDISSKMDKTNPVGTGSFSMNRGIGTDVGDYSVAEGFYPEASGKYSHSEGYFTVASNDASHSEGSGTTASGKYSHAEGNNTTASGEDSHAEGINTTASGKYSHAEGYSTTASAYGSHAEGFCTEASGSDSHAEGTYTKASSENQHVFGKYNIEDSSNTYAEIVGNGSNSSRSNAYTLDWDGNGVYSGDVTSTSGETTYSLNTVGTALNDTVSKSAPVISGTQLKSSQLTGCGNEQILSALQYNGKYRIWLGNPKLEMLNLEVNGNSYDVESLFATFSNKQDKLTIDTAMSSTSTNPVQNKVINSALSGKVSTSDYANGTGTINTTYAGTSSSRYVKWTRWGKVVRVSIYDIIMTTSCKSDGSTSVIASGLPKAKYDAISTITSCTGGSGTRRIGIAAGSTNIVFWWTGTVSSNTGTMTGQLVYIAE